jgi:hypothetical protein
MAVGAWMIVAAILLPIPITSFIRWARTHYAIYGTPSIFRYTWLSNNLQHAPPILAALLFLAGIFLLTRAEGYPPADLADRWRRRALRIFSIMPLLSAVIAGIEWNWMWQAQLTGSPSTVRVARLLGMISTGLVTFGCVPLPLLLLSQLRNVARRTRSAHLMEHCAIVGIGTAAALLFTGFVSCMSDFMERFDNSWMTRSVVAGALLLIAAVAASLFALWAIYLLIRFAISFHKAARELKRKWNAADRSTTHSAAQWGAF